MASRLSLHNKFKELIGNNVYFQPPASIRMSYPCIIYQIEPPDMKHADDIHYLFTNHYKVIYVDRDPDNDMKITLLKSFPMMRMTNFMTVDNLNQYHYDLYY